MRRVQFVPGLIVSALGLLHPAFRRVDGSFEPVAWAVVVGGGALAIAGIAWGSQWKRFGILFATALMGHACAVQLIFAPPYSVYQRVYPWEEILGSWKIVFLAGLLMQTVVTLWAFGRWWPDVQGCWQDVITRRRLFVLCGIMAVVQVYVTEVIVQYVVGVILGAWIAVVAFLNLAVVAAEIPPTELQKAREWVKTRFGLPDEGTSNGWRWDILFPWGASAWVTMVAAILAWGVLEGIPHVPDSMSYIFQAKYFALGRLYMPAPPDAASFAVTHIVNDGTKWFAYGFPGWPAVLALGVLVGFPWVVNPILGGLSILLIHKILSELYGKGLAHAVIGLLAVSPWFLFTSASFMAHSASLLWALLAIRGVQNARRAPVRWGTIAGLALGMLFLTRPLEGILVGGVIGLWALWLSGQPVAPRGIAAIVVAGVFLAILAFPYNKLLTGSATYPPHMKWTDEAWYPGADRLGFGPNIGNVNWPHLDPFPGHGLLDVVVNAKRNLYMSNFELFGWGFGSLGFVWVGLLLGGEWRREDWLFLAIILSVVGGHSLYWSSGGPDFGARYWYQALIPFIVLTVRGVQMVQARCRAVGYGDAARRMTAFVGISCVVAFVNVMPWRSFGKYYHYRGMSAQINRLAEQHEFGKSLVLIQSRAEEDYPSAFVFNPPTLDGPTPIYARDAGPTSRAILRERYKDREVWILGKTRSSGGEFRILAGPLPSGKTAEAERRPSHGPGPRDEGF